jgi:hypothetical protein
MANTFVTMEILINNTRTIEDVQKEFSREFPYLKIEFFDNPHTRTQPSPKSKMHVNTKKLGAIRKPLQDGAIAFNGSTTVAELEDDFWTIHGLSVQVFRKSGKLWIETSLTDSWTLDRQNEEGKEFTYSKLPSTDKDDDFDPLDRDKYE